MSLSASFNDDRQTSSEGKASIQLPTIIVPLRIAPKAAPSPNADTSLKRTLDRSGSMNYRPIDPNNLADMRARMDEIYAKRQKAAPRVDEDVETVFHEGTEVSLDISGPRPPNERQLDRNNLQNPKKAPKVAVKVGDCMVIGGTGLHPVGYALNLLLDGGADGQPSVSLVIRLNKENQDQALCSDKKDVHRFVVQYLFDWILDSDDLGNDLHMIESFSHAAFHPSYPPAVPDPLWHHGCVATQTCKPSNQFKLITMKMKVHGVRVTGGEILEDLQEHPDNVFAKAITELLNGPFPLTLDFWFEWKRHAVANEKCLSYLQQQIESRSPTIKRQYSPDR